MSEHRDPCASGLSRTFREESDGLYRLARRMLGCGAEAEDAVQDAFLRLTRRGERPDGFVSARAFTYRIVRNLCIDRLRARTRQSKVISETRLENEPKACCTTPETDVLFAESFRRIAEAMSALPVVEAEALSLVVVEGLSYQEVAAATEVPIGTVRSRLNRARQTLRAVLHDISPRSLPGTETPAVVDLPRRAR